MNPVDQYRAYADAYVRGVDVARADRGMRDLVADVGIVAAARIEMDALTDAIRLGEAAATAAEGRTR